MVIQLLAGEHNQPERLDALEVTLTEETDEHCLQGRPSVFLPVVGQVFPLLPVQINRRRVKIRVITLPSISKTAIVSLN